MTIIKPTRLSVPSQTVPAGVLTPIIVNATDGMNRQGPVVHDTVLIADQGGSQVLFAATAKTKPSATAEFTLKAGQSQTTVYVMVSSGGSWPIRIRSKVGGLEPATAGKITVISVSKPVTGGTTTSNPVAPPQAVASGFSNLLFNDDFTNPSSISDGTVDALWYVSSPVEPSKSIKLSDLTFTNSCVTIKTDNTGYSADLFTYTSDDRKSFTPTRGYFEARLMYDPKGHIQGGAWPAFWLYDLTGIKTPSANFAELDIIEAYPKDGAATPAGQTSTIITTVHEWSGNSSQVGNYDGNVPKLPTGFDPSQFHIYGVSWTDTDVTWYIDNVKYTSSPIGPGTKFPSMTNAKMVVILGTGKGWPMTVDWARVWG
jgi:beta-glucanase (GH16 family)